MSFSIAVAGKGGTGKTTIAALIVEAMRRKGRRPILAVDADPNSTLGEYLGIKYKSTVSDLIDETKGLRNLPDGMSKPAYLEYQLQNVISESKDVDLMVMGRPEGPDCYCMANNILRDYMHKITSNYPYVVMDNEAGMEHLSRKTTSDIDALILVSDPTVVGLQTVKRIKELIDGMKFLNIKKKYLLVNRLDSQDIEKILEHSSLLSLRPMLIGTVPLSDDIIKLGQISTSIVELPDKTKVLKAINELLEKLNI